MQIKISNSLIAISLILSILSLSLTLFSDVSYSLRDADRDYDGIVDELDKCPQLSETFNKFEDEDGCPDVVIEEKTKYEFPDTDGDGLEDRVDNCPNLPETFNDYLDEDGCPEKTASDSSRLKDSDLDTVPDSIDACPDEKETINEFKDGDGCPDSLIPESSSNQSISSANQCLDGKIPVVRINAQSPVCVLLDTAKNWEELGIGKIVGPLTVEDTSQQEDIQEEIVPDTGQNFAQNKLEVIPVSGDISMLIGINKTAEGNVGGNIGVSAGQDGLLIIDDGMEFVLDDIKEKLVQLKTCNTCDNVKFLVNTHWHFDHVENNAYFGSDDTTIVAHDHVRDLLSQPQEQKTFGMKFDAYPKEALPVITFDDSIFIYFNDEKIKIEHFPHGHTDSDSIVYFTQSNVLHLGDLFFNGMFPFVDIEHGGSVQGLTKNIENIIDEYPQDVKIIPGHGLLGDMQDLIEYRTMLVETTKIVQNQMDAGTPLEEIQNLGLPARWEQWSGVWVDESTWISIIYASLTND